MSNIDKATRMIRDLSEVDGETLGYAHAHNIAKSLTDTGLLMADLPEPQRSHPHPMWAKDDLLPVLVNREVSEEKPVTIWTGYEGLIFTPATAREWALALLAAAEHAEGEEEK